MRVALADDSVLFRHGLAGLLRASGVEVCLETSEAGALAAGLGALPSGPPDVAILDLRTPPTFLDEGVTAAGVIKGRFPAVGVLVLSTYAEADQAERLMADGTAGVGYLIKDRVTDVDALVETLRRLAAGGCVVDPDLVADLMTRRRRRSALADLSERELEVLALVARGVSNQGIRAALSVSLRTVENHIAAIFAKLGLPAAAEENRRVRAVLAYLRATGD